MERYPKIDLYKGATSVVEFDMTAFDYDSGYVVLAIYNGYTNEIMFTETFDAQEKYSVVFDAELTRDLPEGRNYKYDLMLYKDGKRYPQCYPSIVEILPTVGGVHNVE